MDGWVLSGILLFLGLAAITVAAFRLRSWRGVRDAKAFHEATFHTSPDAVLISRLDDGHLEEINQGAARLYGYTREQAVGRTTVELGLWENSADRQVLVEALRREGRVDNLEFSLRRQGGELFTGLVSACLLQLKGIPYLVSVTHDISDRKKAEDSLRANRQFLSGLIENNGALIYVKDAGGRYELVNRKWEETTGLVRDEAMGKTDVELFPGELGSRFHASDLAALAKDSTVEQEESLTDATGTRWFISIKFPMQGMGGVRSLCVISTDITERKRLESRMEQLATTDGLTGITNRRHFLELAETEVKRVSRRSSPLILALIDLDHFKHINDTLGHQAGDQALILLARVCQRNIRELDHFARFGGDEFVLLLPDTTVENAQIVLERIRNDLARETKLFTLSVGVSFLHRDDKLEALIERADQTLYRVKGRGRNQLLVEGT